MNKEGDKIRCQLKWPSEFTSEFRVYQLYRKEETQRPFEYLGFKKMHKIIQPKRASEMLLAAKGAFVLNNGFCSNWITGWAGLSIYRATELGFW